jgi:hypothetical protein
MESERPRFSKVYQFRGLKRNLKVLTKRLFTRRPLLTHFPTETPRVEVIYEEEIESVPAPKVSLTTW